MNIMIQNPVFGRETFVSKDGGISSDVFLDIQCLPIPDVGVEIITFGESESYLWHVYTWYLTNTGFTI